MAKVVRTVAKAALTVAKGGTNGGKGRGIGDLVNTAANLAK